MSTVTDRQAKAKRAKDSSQPRKKVSTKTLRGKRSARVALDQEAIDRSTSKRNQPRSKRAKPVQRRVQKPQKVTQQAQSFDEPLDEGFKFTIAHAFILLSYLVGVLLLVIFGSDLIFEVPFDRVSISYDIANVVGGLTLIYLSYNCQRDLK